MRSGTVDEKFSQRLIELRKKSGLSQEKLGERLYVSRQAVSKWECGEAVPDIDNLTALAEIYGVSLDELVNGSAASVETARRKDERRNSHIKLYAAISALLIFVPFVMLAVWLPFIGDPVPAHYNASGAVDRWGSKYELLLFAIISPLLAIVVGVTAFAFRKRVREEDKRKTAFAVFLTCAACYIAFIVLTAVFTAKAASASAATVINFYAVFGNACASAVLLMGSILPFTSQNAIVGVRISSTFDDPSMWHKVNAATGIAFVIIGAGLDLSGIFFSGSQSIAIIDAAVISVALIAAIVVPSVYVKVKNRKGDSE